MEIFSFKTNTEALSLLPKRAQRSNKGDFGRVLLICGSQGMAGAAYLSAKAAYRSGAGLCEIFTHETNRIILQTLLPEAIVRTYDERYSIDMLAPSIERADCVVIGCGLGATPLSRAILSDALRAIEGKDIPRVLDADALNLLSRNPSLMKYAKGSIITPHAKEMERLCGKSVADILAAPEDTAVEYAKKTLLGMRTEGSQNYRLRRR